MLARSEKKIYNSKREEQPYTQNQEKSQQKWI